MLIQQRTIRLLNPASPQVGYSSAFVRDIPDLLQYVRSRFYAALVAIADEPSDKERCEMQLMLQKELVSVAGAKNINSLTAIPSSL